MSENEDVNRAFEITDLVFLIIFTVELVMHFIHKGRGVLQDGWVMFDFIVVLLSWVSLSVSGGGGVQVCTFKYGNINFTTFLVVLFDGI